MSTALITHLDCLDHVVPDHVDEQPARLTAVLNALDGLDLTRRAANLATDEQIGLCHDASYIADIAARIPTEGFECLDPGRDDETFLSPGSMPALRRAAGGAIKAVEMVLADRVTNAFVAVRPPGHHATASQAMGFCIFGNVAIAARYALDILGLDRIAVLDFDVHHGNGTQALLEDDPRALVITSQQMPLWPGTGDPHDRGPHATVMNLALAPGTDGHHAIDVWRNHALHALRAHRPQLILISAGFDAHQDDPLADLIWSSHDFAVLTEMLLEEAAHLCQGRVVSVLEGGYDLDALAASAKAHVTELIKAGQ